MNYITTNSNQIVIITENGTKYSSMLGTLRYSIIGTSLNFFLLDDYEGEKPICTVNKDRISINGILATDSTIDDLLKCLFSKDKLISLNNTKADLSGYYTKNETSGATQIKEAIDNIEKPDLSNYYQKSETSSKTEIDTAINKKADIDILDNYAKVSLLSNYEKKENIKDDVTTVLANRLDNYYQKSETSGATELKTAFDSIKVAIDAYSKTETDAKINNEATLRQKSDSNLQVNIDKKLDSTAYTKPDLTIYEKITDANTSHTTLQVNIDNEVTRAKGVEKTNSDSIAKETTDRKTADTALQSNIDKKLDITAYTKPDLTDYYTKESTSSNTEIATALNEKANQYDVNNLYSGIDGLLQTTNNLRNHEEELEYDISNLETNVSANTSTITSLQTDIAGVNDKIIELNKLI